MEQDRRTFLATLTAATIGVAAGSRSLALPSLASRTKLKRIGIQLYTLRDAAAADLAGTLAALAKIGYKEIELAGFYNHPATEVRDILKANGLTAPSTHVGLDALQSSPAKLFADAKIVGNDFITVSSPPGKHETLEDWKRIAAQFNTAGAQVKKEGFRFAFHNHDAEVRKLGNVVPLELLVQETDPALVSYEMDLYWVTFGGGDPLGLLARHPGRFKMLHIKDATAAPDRKMVDVGAGTIDFKTIFARAKGVEHYFVEHDQPANALASAAASYKYLSNLEY
jgi:sugar phosphate isomerase/epimerase